MARAASNRLQGSPDAVVSLSVVQSGPMRPGLCHMCSCRRWAVALVGGLAALLAVAAPICIVFRRPPSVALVALVASPGLNRAMMGKATPPPALAQTIPEAPRLYKGKGPTPLEKNHPRKFMHHFSQPLFATYTPIPTPCPNSDSCFLFVFNRKALKK